MEIKVRLAQPEDAQTIWEIRNQPEARAVAADPEIIPLAQHIAWFTKKYSGNSGNLCFVAEADGKVVGYCRFDVEGDHYLNSIAIDSAMHGRGLGTTLLNQSFAQLNPKKIIRAEVRKFNTVSAKLFERVGFKKVSETNQNIYYEI